MIKHKLLIFFILMSFTIGCKSSKSTVRTTKKTVVTKKVTKTPSPKVTTKTTTSKEEELNATSKVKTNSETINEYINSFKEIAKSNMKDYGIPSSIILAQGILESGAGKARLCIEANNHFGIKCHKDWAGETITHDDDALQECFRKYNDPADSYRDHALFLTTRSRYAALFQLEKNDYKAWAKGLKNAGYATDAKYPEKLTTIIERYKLFQYDNEVLNLPNVIYSNENSHTVQQGETLYSISKKYNITVEQIKKINNLTDNTISIGQTLLIK